MPCSRTLRLTAAFGVVLLASLGGRPAAARPELPAPRGQVRAEPIDQQPGCSVTLYWDADFKGQSWTTAEGWRYIGDHWNDEISAIDITSGTWQSYKDPDFGGRSITLKPGTYAYVGSEWDDQISSFRCVKGGR